jgi:hypothetical protein
MLAEFDGMRYVASDDEAEEMGFGLRTLPLTETQDDESQAYDCADSQWGPQVESLVVNNGESQLCESVTLESQAHVDSQFAESPLDKVEGDRIGEVEDAQQRTEDCGSYDHRSYCYVCHSIRSDRFTSVGAHSDCSEVWKSVIAHASM